MCVDRDEEAEEEEEEEENGIRSILQPLKYQLLLRAEEEDSGGGEGGVFRVKASSSASAPAAPSLHTLVLLDRVEGVVAGVDLTHVNRRKNASISCPTQQTS
jgi:hypothetical protein